MKKLALILTALVSLCMFVPYSNAASKVVPVGKKVTLTVTSDGTPPFNFQWKKNGVDIPGANSVDYVITSAAQTDAGIYTVYVSNSAGGILSDEATVTVSSPPTKATTNIFLDAVVAILKFFKSFFV